MFAKIVQKTENEKNPDWNGRINLPKENSTNLLKYDSFTKKFIILKIIHLNVKKVVIYF